MPKFQLQIVTQERVAFEGEAESVVAPGELGYFGVLANHAPLLAALGSGKLEIRRGFDVQVLKISGGFLEVQHNLVTILADGLEGELPGAGGDES